VIEAADAAVVVEAEAAPVEEVIAAPAVTSSSASASAPSASAAAVVAAPIEPSSALIEFNKRFRALVEEKDAKEREAKAARRSAGKAALKGLLGERAARIDTRKAKNREDEAAAEREMLDALQGESWSRVVSLVDIHGHSAATAAAKEVLAGERKAKGHHGHGHGHSSTEPVIGDTARFKDILIGLKAKPLAPAATA
jgi:hypothetical protein